MELDYKSLLTRIEKEYPGIQLIGCTTDGDFSREQGFMEDALLLTLFSSDTLKFISAIGTDLKANPTAAMKHCADAALEHFQKPPDLCFALPDGLSLFEVDALNELSSLFKHKTAIIGGNAANSGTDRFAYQFYQNQIHSDSFPILMISGDILYSHGFQTGYEPIGPSAVITKASGNIIHDINHQPALLFLKRFFGDTMSNESFFHFPILVEEPGESPISYLREIVNFNENTGSIQCGGFVKESSTVRITETSRDNLIHAAHAAIRDSISNYPGEHPVANFIFSCTSRKKKLGLRCKEEMEPALYENFPCPTAAGFYTFGEICILPDKQGPFLTNNSTIAITLGQN
jgi:hypothetical protein